MEEKAAGGSSSSSGGTTTTATKTNSLNSLNFGKKIYFEGAGSGRSQEAPSRSPGKRGRTGAAQSHQPPRCQVEGCQVDLSDAKAYYSRHKVCGMHSKSPKVMVGGLEQRFCQQCSRFHQLPEFDQVKRSCRRRLAGHNERRRKPQPGPFFSSRYRSLSSSTIDNYSKISGGGLMMDFSSYSMSASAADSWRSLAAKSCNPLLPWQSNSQHQHPDVLTTTQPGYSGASSSSDTTSALSLLSNQPWISTSQSSSLEFLGTAGTLPSPAASMDQLPFPASWGFKQRNLQATTNADLLHQIPPPRDLGYDQISHLAASSQALARPNDGKYGELKPPCSSYDDDSVQQLQWSL